LERDRIKNLMNIYADDFERALKLEGPFKDEGRLMLQRTEKIIAFLALLDGKRLLDVGCGPGVVALKIDKELGLEVHAVDFSEKQAEKARKLVEREKARVKIFQEDILVPSPNSGLSYGGYDIVLCKDVVAAYSREGKREIIEGLVKYVKPQGHLVMSVLSKEEDGGVYGESAATYRELIKEVTGKEPYIERLDEEALLLYVRM